MSTPLLVFFIVFVLMFVLRMPIPLGMLASSTFYFLVEGTDLKMVAQLTLNQLFSNFTIIAVPLFIFAANLMNEGDITERVFGFSKGLVGRLPGGLGHVNVLASLVFSGMTGSAIADASGLGKMEIAAMRKEGYDDGFSCAITAASACIGPIFPPSIPMVIYAMLSGASVGALFMGGMVPGVLLAIVLMVYVAIISHRRNYPRSDKIGAKAFLIYTTKAIPAILTPVILLVGIYTGVMTPTEAGAVAGIYALLVSTFLYRMMTWKKLKQAVLDTVVSTGTVSLVVGLAAPISYIVAREQIGTRLGNFVVGITDNKYLFLLIINLVFLLLGMFIDTNVIQMVFVPIVLPLATLMGVNLVHLGVVLCFNMMIGLCTPPFGALLFITSGISGTPLKLVVKETLPMLIAMLIVLFLITYIPPLITFLPTNFGLM